MRYIPEFVRKLFRREAHASDRLLGLGDYQGDRANYGPLLDPETKARWEHENRTRTDISWQEVEVRLDYLIDRARKRRACKS